MRQHHASAPKLIVFAVVVATAVGIVACGPTRLESAWVSPNISNVNINRVLALALTNNPSRRRAMEASMVEEIQEAAPEVQAVQSSTVIDDGDMRREDRLRTQLDASRFDARLVMRVTDVSRRDVYVPGRTTSIPVYYRTFWGYYRYWAPIAYEPGYIERDRDVQVETALYSSGGDGELLYSAISRTLNPSSASQLAEEVTSVVAKDLKEKGLLN